MSKKKIVICVMLLVFSFSVLTSAGANSTGSFTAIADDTQSTATESIYPMPAPQDDSKFGYNLQRTMTLLETSTPEHRNKVKILFYGQSISKQTWTDEVARYLRERYPYADLTIENRAIGGFTTPMLVRTAVHDLYPSYPDLVIFHAYGSNDTYRELVSTLRSTTTSEIILQTDHQKVASTTDNNISDGRATDWLPYIADLYGCEFADIRTQWKKYLTDNNLDIQALLIDGAHLNDHGNFLMAELIKRHFKYHPKPASKWKNPVRTYIVGKDVKWSKGKLTLPFDGNRIDLIAANGKASSAKVLIDNKKPSAFPGCYRITRPNDIAGKDWPWQVGSVIKVSNNKPLLLEDWTLKITNVDPNVETFSYEVRGSKTGYDGKGVWDQSFVSKSGRVVIEPEDLFLKQAHDYQAFKVPINKGFEIKWSVKPMFADTYKSPTITDKTKEYVTTLAQGLSNRKHTLVLTALNGASHVPIKEIRVYKPPVK